MNLPTYIAEYSIVEYIGKGSFGVVVKALNSVTDQIVAMKIIPKEKVNSLEINKKLLSKMAHPNLIKIFGVYLIR